MSWESSFQILRLVIILLFGMIAIIMWLQVRSMRKRLETIRSLSSAAEPYLKEMRSALDGIKLGVKAYQDGFKAVEPILGEMERWSVPEGFTLVGSFEPVLKDYARRIREALSVGGELRNEQEIVQGDL